jgi:hypothetical protein
MSRNATASWSGYAHQGKIGFLVALRKLKALHGTNSNLSTYYISYETREDIAISENGDVIEVHQVKAFTSGTTIGSYTSALTAFEACNGGNFLHTVREIENWDNLTPGQNPRSVSRYLYGPAKNYCLLTEIDAVIDTEIEQLLTLTNHAQRNSAQWRKNVFADFLGALDKKIRIEHSTKQQANYNVSFTLDEISEITVNRGTRAIGILSSIKQQMYDAYVEFLVDLDNGQVIISAAKEKLISESIEHIYTLSDIDFEQFLRDINPHSTQGISFAQCVTTDEYFIKENFQAIFIECIREIDNSQFQQPDNTPPHYFKEKYYLLTSINSPRAHLQKCARRILLNDQATFTRFETDYIINENHSGELLHLASGLKDYDPNKFYIGKKVSFITKTDAINQLNI